MVRKLIVIILLFGFSAGLTLGGLNGNLSLSSMSGFLKSLALEGPSQSTPEPTFKWMDESGRQVIGMKPPPNARDVTLFEIKTDIGRYSSDQIVDHFSADIPAPKPSVPPNVKKSQCGG